MHYSVKRDVYSFVKYLSIIPIRNIATLSITRWFYWHAEMLKFRLGWVNLFIWLSKNEKPSSLISWRVSLDNCVHYFNCVCFIVASRRVAYTDIVFMYALYIYDLHIKGHKSSFKRINIIPSHSIPWNHWATLELPVLGCNVYILYLAFYWDVLHHQLTLGFLCFKPWNS